MRRGNAGQIGPYREKTNGILSLFDKQVGDQYGINVILIAGAGGGGSYRGGGGSGGGVFSALGT